MHPINLLPHIKEELYGFSNTQPQTQGWEITKFNIPNIWNKTQGENVVVAVIDTGCDKNHTDLKDNLLPGKGFVNNSSDYSDVNGHGTHVSSTIAAMNNGIGMVGVAPKTKIVPIKALNDQGGGSLDSLMQGLYWAIEQSYVDFITMSLGSPNDIRAIEEGIQYANSRNIVVFCAAGNSGPNVDIMYPAKYSNTIAIGAIDENLSRTPFTCSGDSLDFLAPGHNILGCIPNNKYALMSGTSMSNPFAVGCASLILSNYRKRHTNKLTTKKYIELFKSTALKLNGPLSGIKKYQGYGIINIESLF